MRLHAGKVFLCSVAAATALCFFTGSAVAQPFKGDWPMLNFNAEGLRYNHYETALSKESVKSLQLAWKLDINPQARSSAS